MAGVNNRVGCIDALRGLTMILVVFSHIYIPNESPLNQFFILFRMPLFFFISGYLSFRSEQSWSGTELRSRLGGKVRTMILPATIVAMLYALVNDSVSAVGFFIYPAKIGYWFTFALFNMLVIYYVARYLHSRRTHVSLKLFAKRFYVVSLLCFIALSDLRSLGWVDTTFALAMTFKYMHYFAFGLLCRCNKEWFESILDNGAKMAIIVAGLFILAFWVITLSENMDVATTYLSRKSISIISSAIKALAGYFGIMTVYGFFRRFSTFFAESRVGKAMQFVGRNTLDVYLIHFFVLIGMPTLLYPYIVDTTNILSQLVVGLSVAVAIVALSLLISRIIRLSDYLAYYILGARDVKLTVSSKRSNN